MEFEWDDKKNEENIRKHQVDFDIAKNVFFDERRIEIYDEKHSIDEDRFITIGLIPETKILFVVYTIRNEENEIIRLISARLANEGERKLYYDRTKNFGERLYTETDG